MSEPAVLASARYDASDDVAVLRAVANAIPTGAMVVDARGIVAFANAAMETLFGYAPASLVGQDVTTVLPDGLDTAGLRRGTVRRTRKASARHADGRPMEVGVDLHPARSNRGPVTVVTIAPVAAPGVRADDGHEAALPAAAEFERLLAAMAARFINLPRADVDDAVDDALRTVGRALELDRVSLWQLTETGDQVCTRQWAAPGSAQLPVRLSAQVHLAWTLVRLRAGETVVVPAVGDLPDVVDRAHFARFGTRSAVAVPLTVWGRLEGAMLFEAARAARPWDRQTITRLRMSGTVFANVLARRRGDDVLVEALTETEALRDRLRAENVYLRREARGAGGSEAIVAQSQVMRQLLVDIDQVAATNTPVLLIGETGTGKELIASCIHEASPRRERGMVRVNCTAIPSALLESELFGDPQGASKAAGARQIGRFELAHGSTIFLDEVIDLPAAVQARLLRVLDDRHLRRHGHPGPVPVDVRVIAATHRDVDRRAADGTFGEDLYARLNVFPLRVPPLRERLEDLPALVWRFVEEFSKTFGKRIESIGSDNMEALRAYPWPGNVRELRNVVERAMISATSPRLALTLQPAREAAIHRSARLVDVERQHIASILEVTRWRIRGEHGAAARLGLKPTTLETRMAKLGLSRPRGTPTL